MDKLYKIKEVADYLGTNYDTIIKWIKQGKLPAVRLGTRSWRIREQDLSDFVNR